MGNMAYRLVNEMHTVAVAREDCCVDHKGLNLDPGNQQTGAVRTSEVVGLLAIGAAFSCYPECLTPG